MQTRCAPPNAGQPRSCRRQRRQVGTRGDGGQGAVEIEEEPQAPAGHDLSIWASTRAPRVVAIAVHWASVLRRLQEYLAFSVYKSVLLNCIDRKLSPRRAECFIYSSRRCIRTHAVLSLVSVEDTMGTARLYVGNLSYGTTKETLEKTFAEHGEVVSVNIITDRQTGRPKGFAFVEMSTPGGRRRGQGGT